MRHLCQIGSLTHVRSLPPSRLIGPKAGGQTLPCAHGGIRTRTPSRAQRSQRCAAAVTPRVLGRRGGNRTPVELVYSQPEYHTQPTAGTGDGIRTRTSLRTPRSERGAATNYATPAWLIGQESNLLCQRRLVYSQLFHRGISDQRRAEQSKPTVLPALRLASEPATSAVHSPRSSRLSKYCLAEPRGLEPHALTNTCRLPSGPGASPVSTPDCGGKPRT